MPSTSELSQASWTDEPPPLVRWRSWPLRDNPLVGVLILAGVLVAGMYVFRASTQLHLAVGAAAVLAVAGWRFFVPVTFELNSEGVHQWVFGRHRRIPWTEIRKHRIFPSGTLLLPYEREAPIDVLHGLFLPWGRRREEILAQLRYYLDPPAES